MNPLTTKLTHFLREHEVRNGILLVATSGGADSVALLRALCEVRGEFGLSLRVVHVDHGLRRCSSKDAEWVRLLSAELSVACEMVRLEQPTGPGSVSVEEAARYARYQSFQRIADSCGANWVATAHTADDQVETVLHHILRGTGLKGLSGIPQRRKLCDNVDLVRPLLAVTRRDVESYLADLKQDFRTDPTNLETEYTRNRLRQMVLPLLRTESGGRVDQSLLRLSRQAQEAQQVMESLADDLLQRSLLESTPQTVRLSCIELSGAPGLIVREALNVLWRRQNWPQQAMTTDHWRALAELACGSGPAKQSFPGSVQAQRRGSLLMLERLAVARSAQGRSFTE